jgi:hypothetical protein
VDHGWRLFNALPFFFKTYRFRPWVDESPCIYFLLIFFCTLALRGSRVHYYLFLKVIRTDELLTLGTLLHISYLIFTFWRLDYLSSLQREELAEWATTTYLRTGPPNDFFHTLLGCLLPTVFTMLFVWKINGYSFSFYVLIYARKRCSSCYYCCYSAYEK